MPEYLQLFSKIIDDMRTPSITVKIDDWHMLVKIALQHEEITVSRAGELLGLGIEDMRNLSSKWERK